MKKLLFALGLYLFLGCFDGRAAYSIFVTSQGAASRTVQPGESFELDILLVSDATDTNNSAIFRVVFSAPGLFYESYRWSAPYSNETAEDDSKPLFRGLPMVLQAGSLSGSGYPNNVVDVELSNVTGIQPGFGSGALAHFSISVPLNYAGPTNISVTIEPDSIAKGFTTIPISSTSPFFLTVAEPLPSNLVLVPDRSIWKYLDNGSDQGVAWRARVFDDSSWASGMAELGYGDEDESTVVGYGLDLNNRHITTYFRGAFTINDAAAYKSLPLHLRVKRDDGVLVYLNGTEVFRDNMPAGNVSNNTLALSAAADDGSAWIESTVNSSLLTNGTNVLAVEVHQYDVGSSDISFDLTLFSVSCASRKLNILSSGGATLIIWPCRADGYRLQTTGDIWRQPWSMVTNSSLTIGAMRFLSLEPSDSNRFFRLIKP